MKFYCLREHLSTALSFAVSIVPSNPIHWMFAAIQLTADKKSQTISIVAFDGDMGISIDVDAKVKEQGEFTVPAHFFEKIISKLSDQSNADLTIEASDDILSVTSPSGSYQIRGIEFMESHQLLHPIPTYTGEFEATDLFAGIRGSCFATHPSNKFTTLAGVHIKKTKEIDEADFVGTDGHRLSVASVRLMEQSTDEFALTIPCNILEKVAMLIDQFDCGSVIMKWDENRVLFQNYYDEDYDWCKVSLVGSLLKGGYPEYDKLLFHAKEKCAEEVIVNFLDLKTAIERIQPFAIPCGNTLIMEIDNNSMTLSASGMSLVVPFDHHTNLHPLVHGHETIPSKRKSAQNKTTFIGINAEYLIDYLTQVFDSVFFVNNIAIRYNQSDQREPLILSTNVEGALQGCFIDYLVMPVQIQQ